jgi:hypothetical protein
MSRLVTWMLIVVCLSSSTGCCISFYDRLQNGWLWNHPKRDRYCRPGPPPPKTTPPGPTTPAALPPPPGVQ